MQDIYIYRLKIYFIYNILVLNIITSYLKIQILITILC